jgi:hypothetical protein
MNLVPENYLVSTAQPDNKKTCAESTSNSWTSLALCWAQHNAHLCGAEIYVALPSDARKGTPFGVEKRHITFGSETAKELHNARVLAPHLSFVPF